MASCSPTASPRECGPTRRRALRADDPSPLRLSPRGMRPDTPDGREQPEDPPMHVDADGIADRVQVVDVPGEPVRASRSCGRTDSVAVREHPRHFGYRLLTTGEGNDGVLESYDLLRAAALRGAASGAGLRYLGGRFDAGGPDGQQAAGHGRRQEASRGHRTRATGKAQRPHRSGQGARRGGPGAEWRQMFLEAWRLQRDHFWDPGLSGTDWPHVLALYLPLVDRVATRAELSDLIWEMQGELGTSHAYEMLGDRRQPPPWRDGEARGRLHTRWVGRLAGTHIVRADSWEPTSSSPLVAPGVNIAEAADALLAIGGQGARPGRPPRFGPQPGRAGRCAADPGASDPRPEAGRGPHPGQRTAGARYRNGSTTTAPRCTGAPPAPGTRTSPTWARPGSPNPTGLTRQGERDAPVVDAAQRSVETSHSPWRTSPFPASGRPSEAAGARGPPGGFCPRSAGGPHGRMVRLGRRHLLPGLHVT